MDAAHERGIAVVVDLVLNHTSTEHPWFIASAESDPEFADWYLWRDNHPGYVGPWGQRVWHPEGGRFYYGLFWEGMPDLNLESPEVTTELLDIASFWLDEVGVNGGDAGLVAGTLNRVAGVYADGQYAVFLSNHDSERVMSQLGAVGDEVRLAATLLLNYPGVPFVYYGEEVGMTGRKPDPRLRTPMPWTDDQPGWGSTDGEPWENPQSGSTTANAAVQTGDPDSLLSLCRDLIAVRSEHPDLRHGETITLEAGSRAVPAYLRTIGEDHVLVVANLGRIDIEDYGLSLAASSLEGSFDAEMLIGDGEVESPLVDEAGGMSGYRPFPILPGRTALVISLTEIGD